ncbi:hypothetical protein Turpa_3518 [Turneriella parva DSM 21527]|uniref:Lipoprotein n=1 Tax=Turneriella parva (strain ATCC BAA-1111 / DSM 21527 / NCTC 11395 / H) TaxID=869212 RepID=I4BA48_TURPD|nr:hypothetical protein Turpa_3518 [Turneriella parva DSM 21527]
MCRMLVLTVLKLFLSVLVLSCTKPSLPTISEETTCDRLQKATASLNSRQRKDYESAGFIQPWRANFVLVSEKFSINCDLRYHSGLFLAHKINETQLSDNLRQFVSKHQCAMSNIVLAATKTNVWRGAGEHDIFLTISDELMPCWAEVATDEMLVANSVNFKLLHRQMILSPSSRLIPILEKELNNPQGNLVSA